MLSPLKPPRSWLLAIVGLLLGALLTILLLNWLTPHQFHGLVMQSPQPVSNFELTAHTGQRVKMSDFRGKVVLLYFGYTFCPDVCPATMSELRQALELLRPEQQTDVQVLMVTLDPQRDTPELLSNYLGHFNPTFLGLTGTPEEISVAAAPLGIFYEKHEGDTESGYLISHTSTVIVIDKAGYLRLVYPFDTTGEQMADDLQVLVGE